MGHRGNRNPGEGTRKYANNCQILAKKEDNGYNHEEEKQDPKKELPNQENNETKQEEIQKCRKMEASIENLTIEMREVSMQEEVASKYSQDEIMKEDLNQASDLEGMEMDLQAPIEVHGEK